MAFENGVNWQPKAPNERGRHLTFNSAVEAAFKDLLTEHNPFYDSLVDNWQALFPDLPLRPGRFENGTIYLYVRTATLSFAMRPKLPKIKAKLLALPDAPAKLTLKLEIHS